MHPDARFVNGLAVGAWLVVSAFVAWLIVVGDGKVDASFSVFILAGMAALVVVVARTALVVPSSVPRERLDAVLRGMGLRASGRWQDAYTRDWWPWRSTWPVLWVVEEPDRYVVTVDRFRRWRLKRALELA